MKHKTLIADQDWIATGAETLCAEIYKISDGLGPWLNEMTIRVKGGRITLITDCREASIDEVLRQGEGQ